MAVSGRLVNEAGLISAKVYFDILNFKYFWDLSDEMITKPAERIHY